MNPSIFGIFIFCMLPTVVGAQEATAPSISTDRPAVATGTDLVAPSWIIVENGLGIKSSTGSLTLDGGETLIRYGLSRRVELRWAPANATNTISGTMQLQDGGLSTKLSLPSTAKWPVSSVIGVTTPTGSHDETSGAWDPEVLLTLSHTWGWRINSNISYNVFWTSSPTARRSRGEQLAVCTGWSATPRIGTYVEWAPVYESDPSQAGYTVDTGITYTRGPLRQWDMRVGYTKADMTGSVIAGIGYSFMLRGPFRALR